MEDAAFNGAQLARRFAAADFERGGEEHIAPDLRALNWLSVANRRCSLQTSVRFFIYRARARPPPSFLRFPYLGKYPYLCCRTILARDTKARI